MAVNFPTSPTNGQTFTSGGLTWTYSTSIGAWEIVPSSIQGVQGLQGIQGANGFQGIQGTQGANGFQGIQGTQSIQGIQGISGGGGGGASLTVASDVINATRYIMFANGVSGSIPTLNVSTGITFNPSTNNFTITGTATATQFNSTSDSTLKTNVVKLHNSLDILKKLRPVSYNWKEDNKKSYGVIAQELETVLPELVGVSELNGKKTVNYIPLIAMLIDAIIDLNEKIENNAK